MTGRLEGKVALVTGAGQGIGEAIAIKLAQEGAAVAVAEINPRTGEATAQKLKDMGARARLARTDITDEASIATAIEQTVAAFGALHVLVNNAGKNFYFDPAEMTSENWDDAMNLDFKGAWLCCKYAIPRMVAAGSGSIINITSIHGRMTVAGMFPYAAAKAGLNGMTRSLALDLGPKNIRVNAICPGWVRTDLVDEWIEKQPDPATVEGEILRTLPLGRMSKPAEIANFVTFIASDEASYITGAELYIDGGLSGRFAT
jgi:NAD(P)-dependent dehydrogenase (short-subunit alcohol dehydrogenase family)